MKSDVVFSSDSDEWETPKWLFDRFNTKFNFSLDAAATEENKLCKYFYSKEVSALDMDWAEHIQKRSRIVEGITKAVWINPPYSLNSEFVPKFYEQSQKGLTVVGLLPSRTDVKWWHEYVTKADSIVFFRGRLKFSDSKNSAPFPSCVVIWNSAGEESPPAVGKQKFFHMDQP